ncbi:MAG TPA: segregation/condensation protein A [Parachlamydiaceae bacterium]|nr:segregation/condensation protein A [Parachlamydiaceae bacterium]
MKPAETFTLENFEGPLEFLLYLVQNQEMDIYEIPIQKIMEQYLEKKTKEGAYDVDKGAEFIGMASLLLFIKSRTLLPKHEQPLDENEELDPRFTIIHKLLDYCKFKDAAKELSNREDTASSFFGRGCLEPFETKKTLGIEHLTLQDLASLFKGIMSKHEGKKGLIKEEVWLVSDKIQLIRQKLKEEAEIKFEFLFNPELSRDELIVTFLAVLELMKLGTIQVIKDASAIWIKRSEING